MVRGILEECADTHFRRFVGGVFHQERPLLTIIKIPLHYARVYIMIFSEKNNIVNICPPLGFGAVSPSIIYAV